jgi:AcrR family transcriptional regulator
MQGRESARSAARERAVEVACGLLRARESRELTLESVASAAGITRVTVYNYFGSRRGLLLAVFAALGRRMRAERIRVAMRDPNPERALERVLAESTRAWRRERRAVARVFALAVLDAEVEKAVRKSERARRKSLVYLAGRLAQAGGVGGGVSVAEAGARLGAVTSFQVFEGLALSGMRLLDERLRILAAALLGAGRGTGRRAVLAGRTTLGKAKKGQEP